jgi:hypothetical protein
MEGSDSDGDDGARAWREGGAGGCVASSSSHAPATDAMVDYTLPIDVAVD